MEQQKIITGYYQLDKALIKLTGVCGANEGQAVYIRPDLRSITLVTCQIKQILSEGVDQISRGRFYWTAAKTVLNVLKTAIIRASDKITPVFLCQGKNYLMVASTGRFKSAVMISNEAVWLSVVPFDIKVAPRARFDHMITRSMFYRSMFSVLIKLLKGIGPTMGNK